MTSAAQKAAAAVIFTGHMVDLPGRTSPRFPPSLEPMATAAIERSLQRLQEEFGGSLIGLSSAARGGDLIFLETCEKLGIATRVVLPFARASFAETSVAGVSSGDWLGRYASLLDRLPPARLELMSEPVGDAAFEACNERLLERARELGRSVVLLALLEPAMLQPSGGAVQFAANVRQHGGRIDIIDVRSLRERLGP